MSPRLGVALLLAVSMWASSVLAHQQKEAVTKVLFNPRTGNIEVMHRFLLHDVEHAVKELRGGDANILASESDRQFFSAYVNQRFGISDQDGKILPLKPVGHEIEGRFLWVYAETAIPVEITSLNLRHDALLDIWPEQVNLLNVERDGEVKSVTFMAGSREFTISLDE